MDLDKHHLRFNYILQKTSAPAWYPAARVHDITYLPDDLVSEATVWLEHAQHMAGFQRGFRCLIFLLYFCKNIVLPGLPTSPYHCFLSCLSNAALQSLSNLGETLIIKCHQQAPLDVTSSPSSSSSSSSSLLSSPHSNSFQRVLGALLNLLHSFALPQVMFAVFPWGVE